MKESEKILNEINKTCDEQLPEELKKHILGNLWNLYKSKKEETMDEEYIIDAIPKFEKPDMYLVHKAIENLKNNEKGISLQETKIILDWCIYNNRLTLSKLGVNNTTNSYDGYCELSQLLTIYPLEQLGLKVTKNTANDSFNYPYNHSFGSVRFLINNGKYSYYQYFLIDSTYRQFFIKDRCSKIYYYLNEKKLPDPGFFVKDKHFAGELIKNGYIELNKETAKKYGQPFSESGKQNINLDYIDSIINKTNDYSLNISELDDINIKMP